MASVTSPFVDATASSRDPDAGANVLTLNSRVLLPDSLQHARHPGSFTLEIELPYLSDHILTLGPSLLTNR
jgi:hypothetical protein